MSATRFPLLAEAILRAHGWNPANVASFTYTAISNTPPTLQVEPRTPTQRGTAA